jgi:hypothetical protein
LPSSWARSRCAPISFLLLPFLTSFQMVSGSSLYPPSPNVENKVVANTPLHHQASEPISSLAHDASVPCFFRWSYRHTHHPNLSIHNSYQLSFMSPDSQATEGPCKRLFALNILSCNVIGSHLFMKDPHRAWISYRLARTHCRKITISDIPGGAKRKIFSFLGF